MSANRVGSRHQRPVRTKLPHIGRPSNIVIAFAVFALTVALTGGSARNDIGWLLLMRPVVIICIVAMLLPDRQNWVSIRPLPLLLVVFAGTIAIQLVPLPPSLWTALNGRDGAVLVAKAVGGIDQWRPLSLSPDRTWNSLIALLVPFGALAGFAALDDRQRRLLLWPMLGIVAFSMILGVIQIASGETSPIYWYRVSGRGQLIGLLANRNHQGAMLACALPLLRAWTLFPAPNPQSQRVRTFIGMAAAAAILLYLLVLGSRAGLALGLIGLVAAFLVEPRLTNRKLPARQRWMIILAVIVGLAALLGIALTADRAVSIGRITNDELSTEGRIAAMPTLFHIMKETMPFGTGFGSFVPVYASYEPDALLKPTYFNNAHNDLIELAITGGLPAVAVFVAFLAWLARASWRTVTGHAPKPWRALQRGAAFAILILLLASLADYPLRTPLLGAFFTILCCWLAHRPTIGTSHSND